MSENTIKIAEKGATKFIAHRGVSGLECENTAASFIAAGNRTYFGVETDIHKTLDNNYVCIHDGRTGRVCEVDLVIEQSNLNQLRKLTFKNKDGLSDRAEIIISTAYEYVKICKNYGKICVPELKPTYNIDEIKEIVEIFEKAEYLDNTCFISFTRENLDLIREVLPKQKCQYLRSTWYDELPEMLEKRGMDLDIHFGQLTEERVKLCHSLGISVNCWTVDNPEDAQRLISWGVDYITTNILE